MTRPRTTAWRRAQRHGCDMSLIKENLRKTPAERLDAHRRALAAVEGLRQAQEHTRGRTGVTAETADRPRR